VALSGIIKQYGYPPMWRRTNSFQTLILIILEQQVSLASARAAYTKLKNKIKFISPSRVLALSDEELRSCYFSRQKTVYARELAKAFISKEIRLKKLANHDDDDIRETLKKVKGIGDWTVDIYLLFALQRSDVFPQGDLAMINAFKKVKELSVKTGREKIIAMAEAWRPYRSIATMILWHYYLSIRKKGN
jgi:DNA-3-methyladenine glycosylase II